MTTKHVHQIYGYLFYNTPTGDTPCLTFVRRHPPALYTGIHSYNPTPANLARLIRVLAALEAAGRLAHYAEMRTNGVFFAWDIQPPAKA